MQNEKATDKRTLRHRVWCDVCREHMKPEDELCPDCESYLGETEAQIARYEKQ